MSRSESLAKDLELARHVLDYDEDYAETTYALARSLLDLFEQFDMRVTNARRRFQAIYNESDIEVVKRLAYDGIAEVSGQEWRELTASTPSSEPGLTGDDAVVASSASGSETSSPASRSEP